MHNPFQFIPGAAAQTGRVALVTGGAGGIGAEVVRALASRGYAVAIHAHGAFSEARDLAADLEAAGVPSLAVTANLRDDGAVRALVHRVADHFGRIDAVVTCALVGRGCPLEEVTADDLRTQFDVNCIGTFVAAQEAGMTMVHQADGGCIVVVGDAAVVRPAPGQAGVVAGRAALPAVVRSLAVELAARNPRVRVNAVLSGVEVAADQATAPAARAGTPGHVAHAVLFLLDNDFVTGVCLPVDGGRDLA